MKWLVLDTTLNDIKLLNVAVARTLYVTTAIAAKLFSSCFHS
jgi:hypothetical protein